MVTSYKTFYNAIPGILKGGPKAHREIAAQLKQRYPEICDDSIPCTHRQDSSFSPEWDQARSAEQGLKRKGIII